MLWLRKSNFLLEPLPVFNLIFFAVLAAITLSPNAARADSGDEARLPLPAEVRVFDPAKITESHEFAIAEELFEGLTTISATGEIVPGVAIWWKTSKDGLVWTFHLRKDARWSNGTPVTASDFIFSLRREISPVSASPSADTLSRIAGANDIRSGKTHDLTRLGVRALGRWTVRIALVAPTPWLPMLLTHFAAMPVSRTALNMFGDSWTKPGLLVSNGPYVLVGQGADGEVRLERNRFFHDAASVAIARIRHIPGPAPEEALKRFEVGDFDVVRLSAADRRLIAASHPELMLHQPELATRFLAVNVNKGSLSDVRVRQALTMTLDREGLIETIEQSTNVPAYELVAPGLAGYTAQTPRWASEPRAARIAEARALLAQVPGAPIHIGLTFRSSPGGRRFAAAIAETWKAELGVETVLTPVEGRKFLECLDSHDFELAVVSWDPDFADASNYLDGYRSDAGGNNFGDFHDATFDRLMDEAAHTADPTTRIRLLQAAERRLLDQDAVMPLAHGMLEYAVSPRLKGWQPDPLSRHPSRYLRLDPTAKLR